MLNYPKTCSFFAGTSLSLLLDTEETSGSSFFYIAFLFNMETKLKQQISRNMEQKSLYCTLCYTNIWNHPISNDFDFDFEFMKIKYGIVEFCIFSFQDVSFDFIILL